MKRAWLLFLWVPLLAAQVVPDLFIVQLSGPPAAAVARKGAVRAAAMDRRVQIQREQAVVRAALVQRGAEVVDAVDMVANALIVRAHGVQASELEALPGVARVFPARVVRLTLDHALPLHKVPAAWEALGGQANAGAGVKIGILDTGIQVSHPGFQDASLEAPPGFPKVNNEFDTVHTNGKIIVARDYTNEGAQDGYGHGTATSMAAAGVTNTGPMGAITGVAPKAWLGSYKVMSSKGEGTNADTLRALNDAVLDGMDVVNLSLGEATAQRPGDDPLVQAVEAASASGVIVVVSAGNSGPDPDTIASPATAASAISVGASTSDRVPMARAVIDGAPSYAALLPSDITKPADPLSGPLIDLTAVDATGLACDPLALPAGSLSGKIVLVLRGDCTFGDKLNNVQAAGAIGALLYTHAAKPKLTDLWAAGGATLTAVMVSNADGLEIKARLAANPGLNVSFEFQFIPEVASFSSHGPNVDQTIKPDLLAVGTEFYTATENSDPSGGMYYPDGYTVEQGTSFSAPLVAGAAALLKQARPGLTVQQYRSLLINSATQIEPRNIEWQGAGVLNAAAAVASTVSAYPTSVSFGWGGGTANVSRDLTITNVGNAPDTFTVSVAPTGSGPAPTLSLTSVDLGPGESQKIALTFSGDSLAAGEYQGSVRVEGAQAPVAANVPYWYGAASGTPKYLTILSQNPDTGYPGATKRFYFRVTDSAGVPVPVGSYTPEVTAVSGTGSVLAIVPVDAVLPDAYGVAVELSATVGTDVFEIKVGSLTASIEFQATRHP